MVLKIQGHDNKVPRMLTWRQTQYITLVRCQWEKIICQNWPSLTHPSTNYERTNNIGPNPLAFVYAQASNVANKTIKFGALYHSNSLMLAIPFHMIPNCT